MTPEDISKLLLLAAIVAFLIATSQLSAGRRRPRRQWRPNWRNRPPAGKVVSLGGRSADARQPDAADQLRVVSSATFEKRRLMSRSEAQFFYAAEKAIAERRLTWRVMAQVSLGEVLTSPDPEAFRAINSKRVDILIVTRGGQPVAAIEYQGGGHYQGTAPMRDAVKKEALRRAGVRYIEVTPEHGPDDIDREIGRIADAQPQVMP